MKRKIKRSVVGLYDLMHRVYFRLHYRNKIRKLFRSNRELRRFDVTPILAGPFGSNTMWHDAYASVTGLQHGDYVPEDVFYTRIEPSLNPPARARFYDDKNFYESFGLPNVPKTLGRVIRGRLLLPNFEPVTADEFAATLRGETEVVVKPSRDSGGGLNVRFLPIDGLHELLRQLSDPQTRVGDDLVIQTALRQHADYAKWNSSSINTVRQITLRLDGTVHLGSAVLRMGRSGSRVDNQAAGGVACGISGNRLLPRAFDKQFHAYDRHPDSGLLFADVELRELHAMQANCIQAHKLFPDLDMVSWDIMLDEQGMPRLIEANFSYQEINFHQVCNGPLFGDFTRRVLELHDLPARRTRPSRTAQSPSRLIANV